MFILVHVTPGLIARLSLWVQFFKSSQYCTVCWSLADEMQYCRLAFQRVHSYVMLDEDCGILCVAKIDVAILVFTKGYCSVMYCNVLQCFDAVGWAAGRASGL